MEKEAKLATQVSPKTARKQKKEATGFAEAFASVRQGEV